MKQMKITLKQLFDNYNVTEDLLETRLNEAIYIETPDSGLVKIQSLIRKTDNLVRVTTDAATVVCGENHIFSSPSGEKVYAKDAEEILFVDGPQKIQNKEYLGEGKVYDISIPAPHWYTTPNGMIHHNTNLIKYIVARSKRGAMVTYDPAIMAKDSIFANFAESECGTLVFEDADNLLGRRDGGNDMMVKFLNSSDGLVSNSSKKIIFSTNLENLDDVDPALTRRGRCAGVIKFRGLDYTETLNFLEYHSDIKSKWMPDPGFKNKSYTLAEIYNHSEANRDTGKRAAGFY